MKRLILSLPAAFIVGLLLFCWGYHRGTASVEVQTEVCIDTVFYERPQFVRISDKLVAVNVPRILFAPADTVVSIVTIEVGSDSVQVDVPVRTLEYRDSTYFARVVGPVVGSLVPRLDWIETYDRTVVRSVTKRSRFAVTAGTGVGYTPQGFQPTVGVGVGVILWQW